MNHVVSIVLSEGAIHSGEVRRRLRQWGFSFSNSTFWRAVRTLEIFNILEVERRRGPRGNLLRPSKRLVMLYLGARVPNSGNNYPSVIRSVVAYVENRGRSETGFMFRGPALEHVRWMQVYGIKRGPDGKWFRVEFHPYKGQFPEWAKFVRDMLRVVSAVSLVLGIGPLDLARALAEEYAYVAAGL